MGITGVVLWVLKRFFLLLLSDPPSIAYMSQEVRPMSPNLISIVS